MFVHSFVLEDWALHELLPQPRERTVAITLVASSYVTWTFQTHTFSNSLETLLVLWCLVLVKRIRSERELTMARACAALAFLGVLGTFNRITFPAFLVIPAVQLVPHLLHRPLRFPIMLAVALLTMAVGITMDTEFYTGLRPSLRTLASNSIITPWNNLAYNLDTSNLAQHGLHPFWQHFAANLPQLIGPAFPLILFSTRTGTLFWSGITGVVLLSCFRHQEARFLLPAVPLLLSSVKVDHRYARVWAGLWIPFNVLAGIVFGIYHQGGVVPVQTWISKQNGIGSVTWWNTYSPPQWLLDGSNAWVETKDLMGMPGPEMIKTVSSGTTCNEGANKTLLVVPGSSSFLDSYLERDSNNDLTLQPVWEYRQHIGLDDLDFGDDGVWPTLQRVIGRRGLTVWDVKKNC